MNLKNLKKLMNSNKKLDKVPVPPKPEPPKNNFIDNIRAKIYNKTMEKQKAMWLTVKKFIVEKLVQWLLKIAGGFFLSIGISQNSLEEIIGALVSIIIGIIYSVVTHKKVALSDPNIFQSNKN